MKKQADLGREMSERYDREADAYQLWWAPVLRRAGQVLLNRLTEIPAKTVLDVGTGVGTLLPDLREAFPRAHIMGVDRSQGMLSLAPDGFPLARMDAAHLGVKSASVDLVIMAFMLFHLERPDQALREVHRTLRRGGRLATITWKEEIASPAVRILNECLDSHGAAPPDAASEQRHEALNSREKLERLLSTAGFAGIRSWDGELSGAYNLETFLSWKSGVGGSRRRLDSLSPADRAACLRSARGRLSELGPEDFEFRGQVVYAQATV